MAPETAKFSNKNVANVFDAYPGDLKRKLLALRALIFDIAAATEGVGTLEETLRWRQPTYLTSDSKSGSMIRIDRVKSSDEKYAFYVHCQTSLIESFRERYPTEMTYDGKRAILFDVYDDLPEAALRHCIAMALTYRRDKKKRV